MREQIRANRKAHATDNGLIASGSFRSGADRGRLLENLAAVVRFVPLWKLLLDWERPAPEGTGAARE